jgi:hypothetical protein
MVLNEIKRNIVYDIAASGPPHARIYVASVTLNGKTYSAKDTTKKKAKAKVARMILLCLVQLKDPSIKAPLMEEIMGEAECFNSKDFLEVVCSSEEFYSFVTAVTDKVEALPMASVSTAEQTKSNPVFHLKHKKTETKIETVKEEGSPHLLIFTARGRPN